MIKECWLTVKEFVLKISNRIVGDTSNESSTTAFHLHIASASHTNHIIFCLNKQALERNIVKLQHRQHTKGALFVVVVPFLSSFSSSSKKLYSQASLLQRLPFS